MSGITLTPTTVSHGADNPVRERLARGVILLMPRLQSKLLALHVLHPEHDFGAVS